MKCNQNSGAIGYARISTKEQSTYSIPFQKKAVADYCCQNGLNLLAMFIDDGESSYTFDRPGWIALEKHLRKNKKIIKYLIILDHDRFSRNIAEALTKINQLEKEMGIKVLSIHDPLNLDVSSPDIFLNRAFQLLVANNELLRIRERTKRGIMQAKESGRVVNYAPYGYKNARDENNKPIIVMDIDQAAIVKQIFDSFITGLSIKEIREEAKRKGFHLRGRSAITRIIANPVYAGLIKIPAYNNNPQRLVKSLHNPIICESVFRRANELLNGKTMPSRNQQENIFLRGFVRCTCGNLMTGGFSKGKKEYYLYYRCMHEKGINYRGDLLHQLFYRTMKALIFSPELKACVGCLINQYFEKSQKVELTTAENNTRKINELINKEEKLEEYLIDNHIDINQYKKWKGRLQQQKADLQQELDVLRKQTLTLQQGYREKLSPINNVDDVFNMCHFSCQQKLIRKIFQTGLSFDGTIFKVSYIHPVFLSQLNDLAAKGLLLFEYRSNIEYFSSTQPEFDKEKIAMLEQEFASFIVKLMNENLLFD